MVEPAATAADALSLVGHEVQNSMNQLIPLSGPAIERAVTLIEQSSRVFFLGAGRSGLALRMTAMRLMHLGMQVHVVGDVTTPSIALHDVLVVASGSGTTHTVLHSAAIADTVGARVISLTTAPTSPLAELSSVVIEVPAAGKQDHRGLVSSQYAGSLFEQTVVLVGDAIFHELWSRSGRTANDLWPQHANLE